MPNYTEISTIEILKLIEDEKATTTKINNPKKINARPFFIDFVSKLFL